MKPDPIRRYLGKRADLVSRPLVASGPLHDIEHVVVIPVLAEEDYLFETLASLAANPEAALARTLVICVVNNRAVPHARLEDIEENRRTLTRLDALVHGRDSAVKGSLRAAYVDASSPGRELPPKDGVGLARKIGMDRGLSVLHDAQATRGVLLSLDADTLVQPNYIEAVRQHFTRPDAWAGVTAYAHRLDGSSDEITGILCYELFLRYHAMGLAYAGSPYAFAAIGSTIACRAEAYAAVSGMNRRQAGEDFYFLQELAKTGRVDAIRTTKVYPSCRASERVPFGTGQRVRRFSEGRQKALTAYHPKCYRILKQWLAVVANSLDAPAQTLLSRAGEVCPHLAAFLEANGFERAWDGFRAHSPDARRAHAQFHRWFDGLKTLRLIHHLRDNGFPRQDLFQAIDVLLTMTGKTSPVIIDSGISDDPDRQLVLLNCLRA